ncbi:hypothetical protein O9G_001285 [Rozella allomycis CSF55]|uniref:Uncharacterized protein n=1 Tax=Rozella allomycis (strain CSF55) TaxID=988480 RepID=A0A075AY98_ROZAC|nr:hypothetical protein O9G_001285 [Rozella allomycis CSF55]|eukprot:EPZ33534.1 hypothetical protein O9G_001285 [Rozella allomycis CSF55]
MHSETAVTVERPYSPANDVPTSSGDEAVRKRRRRKSNFKASIEDNEDSDDEEFKVGRKNMTTSAVSDEETIN